MGDVPVLVPTKLPPMPKPSDFNWFQHFKSAATAWADACQVLATRGPVEPPPMPQSSDFRDDREYAFAVAAWKRACGADEPLDFRDERT